MGYGQGFCRWLSYRSRDGLRATSFALEIDEESEGSEETLSAARLFFDSTSFNPAVPWHLPKGMQVAEGTKPTLEPSRGLLHFPQSLKRWGIKEYKQGKMERSLDLFLSSLVALSEFDDCLAIWHQSRDLLLPIWKQLSYDVLTNILQVYLYQKSLEEAASLPFDNLIHLTFDDHITSASKIRFLCLYARFWADTGEIDKAFAPLRFAYYLDPKQQEVRDMLSKLWAQLPSRVSAVKKSCFRFCSIVNYYLLFHRPPYRQPGSLRSP